MARTPEVRAAAKARVAPVVGASGNGGRLGGARANLEAFTETQWVTVRGDLPPYPF